jgi:CPA1 family monovalent cation:H+ antiporter
MELFLVVLVLLGLIGLSMILNRLIPFIPVPLIQIALGVGIAYLPSGIHLPLDPELFFVLFIAPLLFNDGKRMPREQLWNLRLPIILLALGLVFVTVFMMGYVIHWMIPSIPLAAAFALAAILSPTDAVAVGALAGRSALPKSLMHLLEGEALMNDASGLVAFKFAVAATVTGFFSLFQAASSFTVIALGGLACGVILSYLLIRLRMFIRRSGMEDVTMHMLILLLTPFILYMAAEEIGVSGILAVVAGGITHAVERDHSESVMAKLQVVSTSTWSVILFILNGIVFLILGLQIPAVTSVIFRDAAISNTEVIAYIVIISLCLLALRFTWNYVFLKERWITEEKDEPLPHMHSVVLITISGVRGTLTLAGAFSIPFVLQDGSAFPERSLIIFLAAGVILFTLIAASILLPLLAAKHAKLDSPDHASIEYLAHKKVIGAVIKTLKEEMSFENKTATLSVIARYEKMYHLPLQKENSSALKARATEANLRMICLRAEQAETEHLLETGQISQDTAYHLQKHIKEVEAALSNQTKLHFFVFTSFIKRLIVMLTLHKKKNLKTEIQELRFARIRTSKAAIAAIREHISDETKQASVELINGYYKSIERLSMQAQYPHGKDLLAKQKKELQLKAIQIERNEVQTLFENGEINRDIANNLRRSINYFEATILEEEIST